LIIYCKSGCRKETNCFLSHEKYSQVIKNKKDTIVHNFNFETGGVFSSFMHSAALIILQMN